MSGHMWRSQDGGGMAHPDDSILLAYTRQQPLGEDWQNIHLHIMQCTQCYVRREQFAETNTLLGDTLAHFQYSQVYPSLTEGVIELAQHGRARTGRRLSYGTELLLRIPVYVGILLGGALARLGHLLLPGLVKPRRKTMVGLPVFGVLVLLLLMFGALAGLVVLSFPLLTPAKPGNSSNNTAPDNQPSGVTVLPHLSMTAIPTVGSRPTARAGSTATATPAVPASVQPTLKPCSPTSGISFSTIRICGSNFTPGDKVELIVSTADGQPKSRHPVNVNAQGSFQDAWIILTCVDYPVMVSAQDLTHPSEVPQPLRGNSLGQCAISTPVPGVPRKY